MSAEKTIVIYADFGMCPYAWKKKGIVKIEIM